MWGSGNYVVLILKLFAMLYSSRIAAIHVAPAVRVGYCWAHNNLHVLQTYVTICYIIVLCGQLLLGQAQLV